MDAARDPFDELTALFLSDDPSPETPPSALEPHRSGRADDPIQPDSAKPRLTIAICGHLPVMAGLWVTQYADRIAAKSGPTGLVRLEGGRCSIEIFSSKSTVVRPEGVDLAKSAGILADGLHRWIVCVDDRDAAEAVRAGADEVVILTAAEQPAVIEAYRLAKSAAARVPSESPLDLGLVVVGADPERAESAGDVLSEAATRHLDRPLPVVATVRRLDVVEGSQRLVFDESVRRSTEEVVSAIRASLDLTELRPEVAVRPDEEGDATPESSLQAGGLRLAGFDEPKDNMDGAPEEPSPAFGRRATDAGAMQPLFPEPGAAAKISRPRTSFRSVRLRPSPIGAPGEPAFVAEEEPGVDVSRGGSDEMDRAESTVDVVSSMDSPGDGFVGLLPELLPTGLRCPIASGVEFAADASGTVHVLCSDAELESARIADAWLHGNRELIASATDFSGVSTIHVFTSDAPRVADLHRTGLRLHLVIGDGDERRSVPLNSDHNAMIPG